MKYFEEPYKSIDDEMVELGGRENRVLQTNMLLWK